AGSAGRAMFELHGGDLAIANLGFGPGAARPKHWVLSEDGILAIRHCYFRETGPANASAPTPEAGPSIVFVAKGTAPIPPRTGPLEKETNRPIARLKDSLIWA